MAYDPNQKHPKLDYEGTYPNLHVEQGIDGHQIIRSLEPGKETVFFVEPTGNYTGHGRDGQQVSVTVGKNHSYTGDGSSSTTDGHSDSHIIGSSRTNVGGGTSSETGGNSFAGVGGASISGSKDSSVHSSTAGDSFATTEGNITTDHTGDMHQNITGDVVTQISGNKAEIIHGDMVINNQGGSIDVKVDGGKLRLKSASDIIIDSDTRITLKCGGTSITIDQSTIQLLASAIKMVNGG